jgi:hypothetical protein
MMTLKILVPVRGTDRRARPVERVRARVRAELGFGVSVRGERLLALAAAKKGLSPPRPAQTVSEETGEAGVEAIDRWNQQHGSNSIAVLYAGALLWYLLRASPSACHAPVAVLSGSPSALAPSSLIVADCCSCGMQKLVDPGISGSVAERLYLHDDTILEPNTLHKHQ